MIRKLNSDLFSDKEYLKRMMVIAIPIIVQNLILSSLNMIDTVMVGMLGDTDIASVGIGNQIFLLFHILSLGVSSGCGIFISQYWGKGDRDNIRRVLGFAIVGSVIISLIFKGALWFFPEQIISIFNKEADVIYKGSSYIKLVGLSYIFNAITLVIATASRCVEKTRPPMVVSIMALFLNAGLNYVFIFGRAGFEPMGVRGAAMGTLIARIFEFIVLFLYSYKTNKVLWGDISKLFDISLEFGKKIFDVVKDVLLNELCWGLGVITYSIIYGRMGSSALAAVQIYNTVQNLFLVLVIGMASATVVIIGKEIGRGDYEKANRYSYNTFMLTMYIGILLSFLIALTAKPVVGIFNISESVARSTEIILYVTAVIFTIRSLNIILIVGILRGGADSKFGFRTEAFTTWVIGVPATFIGAFIFKLPIHWVVALICAEEFTKIFLATKRLFSEKWMRSVT